MSDQLPAQSNDVVIDASSVNESASSESAGANYEIEARFAKASEMVKRNMLWAAGAGVLPVPMLELVAITAVELKLVKELADLYGADYRKDLAKAAVLSLIGSLGSITLGKMIAMSSLRAIPVFGHAVAVASVPALSAAITYAIGKVFVAHFEAGGSLLDFDSAKVREYFRSEFANGIKVAKATITPDSAKNGAAA